MSITPRQLCLVAGASDVGGVEETEVNPAERAGGGREGGREGEERDKRGRKGERAKGRERGREGEKEEEGSEKGREGGRRGGEKEGIIGCQSKGHKLSNISPYTHSLQREPTSTVQGPLACLAPPNHS